MSLAELLAIAAIVVLAYVTAIWLLSLVLRNASIIDIFWGPGFVILAWLHFALGDGWETRSLLMAVLVTAWGLRLGGYILWRNWGEEEDKRYQKWRNQAPDNFWWRSYLQVFLLQGAVMWIVATPLAFAAHYTTPDSITVLDILGVAVWIVGFIFEAGGDYQLSRFKGDPENKGKVMDRGLWRYTRHPNYFGDATQWWGFWLIAASTPWGFATVFSPVLMTFLLARVSGVTLLESDLSKTKPQYREYVERTSAFFPLPPKNS